MAAGEGAISDLGALEGPVLLYGGPYSNLHAVRALFDRADALGIPPGRRICTGDVIAYGADPVATWDEVARRGGTVVAGNTERQLAGDADDCGCGFDEGSACDLLSRGWYPFARQAVAGAGAGLRAALGACPDMAVFSLGGRRFAVLHGGARDIARYLWPSSPEAAFAEEIAAAEARVGPVDGVVAGHSGLAFCRTIGGLVWINAGAVGLPPHDGRPETRFTVLSEDGPRYHRLGYDHDAAARAMAEAGLTQGYDRALISGVWPSEDILPPELKGQPRRASG